MRRSDGRDAPAVVAHPPVIYGGAFGLALALDRLVALPRMPTDSSVGYGLALALAVAGLSLGGLAVGRFLRAGTNVPTNRPVLAFVTAGPYRITRNPIYVGLTLVYLGLAVASASWTALALLAPVLLVMHYGVVKREEVHLESKFGAAYRAYKGSVRRWI